MSVRRRAFVLVGLMAIGFWTACTASAAPGDLDPRFGNGGIVQMDLGMSEFISTGVIDSQGRILVAGSADDHYLIARFLRNGDLDVGGFGEDYDMDMQPDGYVTLDLHGNAGICKLILDLSGLIYAVGSTKDSIDLTDRVVVARFTADGVLDTTFGDMITPGYKYYCSQVTASDASADGGPNIFIYGTLRQSGYTNRGSYSMVTSQGVQQIACTENSPSGGTQGDSGDAIIVQNSDLYVLVSGHRGNDLYVTRYEAYSTTKDSSFDGDGTAIVDHNQVFGDPATIIKVSDLALDQQSGHPHFNKPVVAGWAGSDFLLVRFNTNGSLDSSFNHGGIRPIDMGGAADRGRSVVIDHKGRIVIAGETDDDIGLARARGKGKPDKHFGPNSNGKVTTLFNDPVNVGSVLTYGKKRLIVVGNIGPNNNSKDILIVRYKAK